MKNSLSPQKNIIPRWFLFALPLGVGLALLAGVYFFVPQARRWLNPDIMRLYQWFQNEEAHRDWNITANQRCGGSLMNFPTEGFIGFDWGDSFRVGHSHSGFDIFGTGGEENVVGVYAAYDGYLTREASWLSTVIIRHPDFPAVVGGEQIWTYYTHMASEDGTQSYISSEFPRDSHEIFVRAGTLLGYQGTWSGDPNAPVGLHLHFSVVKSAPDGSYLNEAVRANTYNPADFLGVTLQEDGTYRCDSAAQGQ